MVNSVYICSAPRSGSTILDLMMGTHPEVLDVGELNQFSKNIALNSPCTCGSGVRECKFWRPFVDRYSLETGIDLWKDPYKLGLGMFKSGVEIDTKHQTPMYLMRRMIERGWIEMCHRIGVDLRSSALVRGFRAEASNMLRLHTALRLYASKKIIVDSSKDFRHSVIHYRLAPEQTRMILLARDGRGVMASYMRSGATREAALADWQRYYQRALPWLERHVDPQHLMRVHYEDLVSDPDREVGRIYQWLGLDPVGRISEQVGQESHIVNGNRMTMRPARAGIQKDERWRTALSPVDLEYFHTHGRALSLQLGYSPDRDR